MTTLLLALTASLSATAPPPLQECRHEAKRTATVAAADARLLRVLARAGSLEIEGRPGLTEVRIRGRACASDADLLEGIHLNAERRGSDVLVEAELPRTRDGWLRDSYARLNLTLEVPAGMAADIDDSSGEMELRGLGALTIDDSSGEITVEDITGPVTIDDSSGEITGEDITGPMTIDDSSGAIELARVGGDLEIDDDSGEIEVRGVAGSVVLEDSSGDIDVSDVTGTVHVRRDGSGSIRVADVLGDFIVDRDGSGDIRHSNVGGAVRIPPRS